MEDTKQKPTIVLTGKNKMFYLYNIFLYKNNIIGLNIKIIYFEILFKGFGLFRDYKINPSWEAVQRIKWSRSDIELVRIQIPVVYKLAKQEVDRIWSHYKPLVCLGFFRFFLHSTFCYLLVCDTLWRFPFGKMSNTGTTRSCQSRTILFSRYQWL